LAKAHKAVRFQGSLHVSKGAMKRIQSIVPSICTQFDIATMRLGIVQQMGESGGRRAARRQLEAWSHVHRRHCGAVGQLHNCNLSGQLNGDGVESSCEDYLANWTLMSVMSR
jgi:hypothetical protein